MEHLSKLLDIISKRQVTHRTLHVNVTGGEHFREGRDLSSAAEFAQRLDLHVPFEELELTKLIGGGGFGQVFIWLGLS